MGTRKKRTTRGESAAVTVAPAAVAPSRAIVVRKKQPSSEALAIPEQASAAEDSVTPRPAPLAGPPSLLNVLVWPFEVAVLLCLIPFGRRRGAQ